MTQATNKFEQALERWDSALRAGFQTSFFAINIAGTAAASLLLMTLLPVTAPFAAGALALVGISAAAISPLLAVAAGGVLLLGSLAVTFSRRDNLQDMGEVSHIRPQPGMKVKPSQAALLGLKIGVQKSFVAKYPMEMVVEPAINSIAGIFGKHYQGGQLALAYDKAKTTQQEHSEKLQAALDQLHAQQDLNNVPQKQRRDEVKQLRLDIDAAYKDSQAQNYKNLNKERRAYADALQSWYKARDGASALVNLAINIPLTIMIGTALVAMGPVGAFFGYGLMLCGGASYLSFAGRRGSLGKAMNAHLKEMRKEINDGNLGHSTMRDDYLYYDRRDFTLPDADSDFDSRLSLLGGIWQGADEAFITAVPAKIVKGITTYALQPLLDFTAALFARNYDPAKDSELQEKTRIVTVAPAIEAQPPSQLIAKAAPSSISPQPIYNHDLGDVDANAAKDMLAAAQQPGTAAPKPPAP